LIFNHGNLLEIKYLFQDREKFVRYKNNSTRLEKNRENFIFSASNFIVIQTMNLPQLPNNRLILNGHRLHSVNDLFAYVSRRLKRSEIIDTIDQLIEILSNYKPLQIAIRHGDTFL
jgi:hypothetical protein